MDEAKLPSLRSRRDFLYSSHVSSPLGSMRRHCSLSRLGRRDFDGKLLQHLLGSKLRKKSALGGMGRSPVVSLTLKLRVIDFRILLDIRKQDTCGTYKVLRDADHHGHAVRSYPGVYPGRKRRIRWLKTELPCAPAVLQLTLPQICNTPVHLPDLLPPETRQNMNQI